jgi:DHA1 family tetracycline resistance protein-like MFS transporter
VALPERSDQIKRGVVAKRERTPVPKGYWTIWTTVALDLIGFGIIVPILGRYAERFGASGLTVGFLFASFSLAQLLCAPLLGRLSDRIGRKPVIVISLIGTAIGSFITGAAGVLWLLFAGRIVDGASGGSLSVAQAAVADLAPEAERPRLIGMLGAAFGVGFVLGPAIGGLAALGGPHVPFYVAGVLASINAVAAIVRLPETRVAGDRVRRRGLSTPTSPILRHLAVIGFTTVVAFTAFEATFSLFGDRRFGLTEASSAAVFLGVGLVLVAIQGGAYGRLVERFGTERLFTIGLSLLIAGLAVTAVAKVWPVLIIALLLLSIGQGCASPSITSLVTQHAPADRRGEALGFQQSSNAIGRVLGPPAAGAMFDRVGIWSPYIAGSVLCAVSMGLVVTWGLDRRITAVSAAGCENVGIND